MKSKLLFKAVLIALATLSLAIGVRAQGTGATAADAKIPALKITAVDDRLAPVGWQRYQIGEPFVFSAVFPKQPVEESGRVSGRDGSMIVRSYIAPSEAAVYGVIYSTDLPGSVEVRTPEQKKKAFDDFMLGFANGVMNIELGKENPQYKVTADRQVKVGNLDGYEKEFMLGAYHGRAQTAFMGRDRVAIITLWNESADVKERTAFFSSLALNPRR